MQMQLPIVASTAGSPVVGIPVADSHGQLRRLQSPGELFNNKHGAVPSTRAPDREREVALAFANVKRNQITDEIGKSLHELACLRKRQQIPGDPSIPARQ